MPLGASLHLMQSKEFFKKYIVSLNKLTLIVRCHSQCHTIMLSVNPLNSHVFH